jgi:hypothetical protein
VHSIRAAVQAPVPTLHDPPPGQLVVCWHPDPSRHVSAVQATPSSQLVGVPTQLPPAQTSPVVHVWPSLHGNALLTKWHPSPLLQESVVQTLLSVQLSGVPAWHWPVTHVSAPLHTFASSHCALLEQPET